jgi:hypothetical protein
MKTLAALFVLLMLAGCGGGDDAADSVLQCLNFNAHGQFEWGPCPDNTTWTK